MKISKNKIHRLIEKKFGKASNYKCIDCKKKAYDWSFDKRKGYSINFKRYNPRCRSCHLKKDYIKGSKDGNKNGFYGKKHKKSTIDKISKERNNRKIQPMFGKKHSKKTKLKMRKPHKKYANGI